MINSTLDFFQQPETENPFDMSFLASKMTESNNFFSSNTKNDKIITLFCQYFVIFCLQIKQLNAKYEQNYL